MKEVSKENRLKVNLNEGEIYNIVRECVSKIIKENMVSELDVPVGQGKEHGPEDNEFFASVYKQLSAVRHIIEEGRKKGKNDARVDGLFEQVNLWLRENYYDYFYLYAKQLK